LLGGLEAVEVKLSDTIDGHIFRFDAEHYQKIYFKIKNILSKHKLINLSNLTTQAISTGHTPSMKNRGFYGGEIKFIKTDNLRDNFIKPYFENYLSELGNNDIKRTQLKQDDIIVTIIGATKKIVGRATKINSEILPANINQNIALIRVDREKINPDFINIYFNSYYGKQYLYYLSRQTEQVNLNCEEIGRVKIPIFTSIFQNKIEKLIKSVHEKIEESKANYQQTENLLLTELGLLDFKPSVENIAIKSLSESFGESGRLDSEYYQPKYDDIENKISKSTNKSFVKDQFIQVKKSFNKSKQGYNYIEIGNVNVSDGTNVFNYVETEYLPANAKINVANGDLLVSTVRPNRGAITIIHTQEKDLIVSGAFTVLRKKEGGKINTQVLQVLLRTKIYNELLLKYNVGTQYPVIKDEDVMNLIIPIIDKSIQNQVEEKIESSFKLKAESKQLLELAKQAVEIAIEQNEEQAIKLIEGHEG